MCSCVFAALQQVRLWPLVASIWFKRAITSHLDGYESKDGTFLFRRLCNRSIPLDAVYLCSDFFACVIMNASVECAWYWPIRVFEIYVAPLPATVINNTILKFDVLFLKNLVHESATACACAWYWPTRVFEIYIAPLPAMVINNIILNFDVFLKNLVHERATACACAWCIDFKGGHRPRNLTYGDIENYLDNKQLGQSADLEKKSFEIIKYELTCEVEENMDNKLYLHLTLPPAFVVQYVPVTMGRQIAALHGLNTASRERIAVLKTLFESHSCHSCDPCTAVLLIKPSLQEKKNAWKKKTTYKPQVKDPKPNNLIQKQKNHEPKQNNHSNHKSVKNAAEAEVIEQLDLHDDLASVFPPDPVDKKLSHQIVTAACAKLKPEAFEEAGCAVCGQLVAMSKLSKLSAMKQYLHLLENPGTSQQERHKMSEKIRAYPIVIDHACHKICENCRSSLRQGKVPRYALANGLWIGSVPDVLSDLRYIEKMLVARVRHSCCSIRVASGMRKMKAHAIAYQQPIPKVYNILPPPKEEIEEVIAIMFTGPCAPTSTDFKRTPFLVRRNHVKKALEWLILNHSDYENVRFSIENLNEYPEDMPPVSIEYKQMQHNKTPEGTSVHDMEVEDGTEEGDCAFTVHGLTGHDLNVMSTNAIKVKALQHLNSQGKILAIGHAQEPESIWHNPQLYPQMFPWLFPYGLGGIGSVPLLSESEHKRRLLMYHDKRFQLDQDFPFVAFSHEQIKTTSTQSYLLADKKVFEDIKQRILTVDSKVLASLSDRMIKEEFVKPETDDEQKCFQLLKDLDHVSGPIKGSNTSKKWMRNEIWSLIYHRGAPFWYITLSPADIKHPLCIYYADSNEKFKADVLPYDERLRLVCKNPVAGARFFHFLVELFITEILGIDAKHRGLYGDVSAYYGTVEQQGRLTLHLHMLIWLIGNLTPQEMRKRILDPEGNWQKKLISWLESCHKGEFMTGTQSEVLEKVATWSNAESYIDPTVTFPVSPPALCKSNHTDDKNCPYCSGCHKWWDSFQDTVDDLISKSNIHNCDRGTNQDGTMSKKYPSCKNNKYGKCKARFPRPTFKSTEVDPETGAISIKKHEEWINFFSPVTTYIMRCNTDVTCLWSGTALKAVIMYVSDYITKSALKTHVIFDAIRSVFDKHSDVIASSSSEKDKARRLVNKIVNTLSTKAEMGAPMVCMYLLGNPDHYTNHTFIPFFWYSFVAEAQKAWEDNEINPKQEKVTIIRTRNRIVGLSPVHDYIYRPIQLEKMSLYEWATCCKREKYKKNKTQKQSAKSNDTKDIDCDESEAGSLDNGVNSDGGDEEDTGIANNDSGSSQDLGDDRNCIPTTLPKNTYRYKRDHPLYNTHIAKVYPKKPNGAINFIGRTLPRCDQGDREFYCLTMLALFKPWRSGLDLKTSEKSWDDTFTEHAFTFREKQLMRNFNIKYECLDAKDDFNAKLKAGLNSVISNWDASNDDDDNDGDLTSGQDPFTSSVEYEVEKLCKSELTRQKEAAMIRDVLRRTGWLDNVHGSAKDIDTQPVVPKKVLTSTMWKTLVQNKKQEILEHTAASKQSNSSNASCDAHNLTPDVVKVVDKAYLEKKYHTTKHNASIDKVCREFELNEEQERAFKIIANHIVTPGSEPLKMYIGGMGGTGKSRVLYAVTKFFEYRNESYRFMIVAPTGTAAALLSGSTYHSALGINDISNESQAAKSLAQVRTRLQGVDYIFMDEVSMLSCHDLYKISCQLCKVMNAPSIPFGGLNILFAGDFAQLPPPMGGEYVSLYSRVIGQVATNKRAQEEALGRALWHQVTTVVILRQNMRQKTQSKEDDKFRQVLENMRYKDCTLADIQFLRSRITSQIPGMPSITNEDFRLVSIITAKNAQKDEINKLGCQKFAEETGQKLTDFYSEDSLKSDDDKKRTKKCLPNKKIKHIDIGLQKVLWNLPHSSSSRPVPGKLSLCIGMPIMIKSNVATELCITNGQEATVVGWQNTVGKHQQLLLDVLFVKLKNPPKCIQLDDLDENVVPLTRTTCNITCKLPDGSGVSISRTQVEILPNFAMTDFASQGKTRPFNPVDLNNCRTHQAYYTALSRSSTAEGTVILQGFDTNKITGRASGSLRQEFRDLELLDDITKLRYVGKLHNSVQGDRRNALIHTFRLHKGLSYIPSNVHHSIKWNKKDPMLDPIVDDIPWEIVTKSNMASKSKIQEKPPLEPSTPLVKTKRKDITPQKVYKEKISKTHTTSSKINLNDANIDVESLVPSGTAWHQNSCAYDAALCIIHAIWEGNREHYNRVLKDMNDDIMGNLASCFSQHREGTMTLESGRDNLRRFLHGLKPQHFTWGAYTSVHHLLEYMLSMPTVTIHSKVKCKNNHPVRNQRPSNNTCCLISTEIRQYSTITDWSQILEEETAHTCSTCQEKLTRAHEFTFALPFIALDVSNAPEINLDHSFHIPINGIATMYKLRGITYYRQYHFTARVIQNNGFVWYHDGLATGRNLEYEGTLGNLLDNNLSICEGRYASVAMYAKCS